MTDDDLITQIDQLVAEEKHLKGRLTDGVALTPEEQARERELEERLDVLWDLLRQRRAHREFGEDPDLASPRDVGTVEGYQQ